MNARSPSFRDLSCSLLPYNWIQSRPISADSAPVRARLRHARCSRDPTMVTATGAMMFDTHKRQERTAVTHRPDWISLSRGGLGGRGLAAAAHAQRFMGVLNTITEGTHQSAASCVEWALLHIHRSLELPTPVFARGGSNGRGR